ncbi:type I secretion system permease/ATPase [Pelagibius litoralis]|uniref:Type I secretion system permease/ATPase n=2 Tax=Pelagibius litoralis TaxID=374515 RepID=A0A967KGP1_9PROT|nr:type I secretion system permease/ATPase [Pelagibius litoralis]
MDREQELPLRSALRQCRAALPVLGLFSFFINLLILTSPLYMMQTFDRVLSSGRVETLVFLTLIAGIAVLIMGVLEAVRARILARVGRWFERGLAPEFIETSMRGAACGLAGGAQSLRDLATIRGVLSSPGVNSVFDAPWVPVFIAVIWLLNPWLGTIALIAAIILFITALVNEYVSRLLLKESNQLAISATRRAGAAIRNADVFHAMGMLPGFLAGWTEHHDRALDLQLKASDRNAALVGFSRFFRLFVQIAILGAGAYLVLQAELTPGGMIAASILLGRALAPVEHTIGGWKGLVAGRDAYGRLRTLLGSLPPKPLRMRLPAPRGRLTCENVIFVPRGREQLVLQGLSFALEPGEALGVVGPSAAGKSTLCKILVGTWQPTRGRARLDGADVFDWPSDQLGRYIGYLPQDVELFDGTVRDNIARLNPAFDSEAVIDAAMTAGVHDIILRLPEGYETEIGDGGAFLSGGQRQRIGLARALYGRPRLIVLDEPNANLDGEGEQALVTAIEMAKDWGATVVLVTHQPRILSPADKLLILREGRVEAFGPRDEVLSKLHPLQVAQAGQGRPVVVKPGQFRKRPASSEATGSGGAAS